MARGSSGGGGGSTGGTSSNEVEMLGAASSFDARGKRTIVKRFFTSNEGDLQKAEPVEGFSPSAITHTKVPAGWEKSVTYEARHGGVVLGSSGLDKDRGGTDRGTFEVFSSYELRPIARHPRIRELKEKYFGWATPLGIIEFSEYLAGGDTSLVRGRGAPNPMYGVTHYKEYTFTFRHTYYADTLSTGFLNRAGTITTKLPANFPVPRGEKIGEGTTKARQFLVQPPNLRREGSVWRIEQDYVLLDAAGFADEMYVKEGG